MPWPDFLLSPPEEASRTGGWKEAVLPALRLTGSWLRPARTPARDYCPDRSEDEPLLTSSPSSLSHVASGPLQASVFSSGKRAHEQSSHIGRKISDSACHIMGAQQIEVPRLIFPNSPAGSNSQ